MNAGARNPLWLRIALPLLALYALVGYLLLPWTLMRLAPDWVDSKLDARLDLGDIHFDPFRLRLVVFEPRLIGPLDNENFAAENVVAADRIEARLLVRSLGHFAPVIALEVDAPKLHFERAGDGVINLASLAKPRETSDQPAPPMTLAFQRLLVSDGRVTVLDHSRPQPFRTTVEAIEVDLRELWLPSGEPAAFWSALRTEGAKLDLRGHLSAAPELDLRVTLVDLPLIMAERWLAGAGPADRLRGSLHGSGRLTLEDDGVPRLSNAGLELHGLDIKLPAHLAIDGTDLAARLRQLRVDAVTGSLWPLDLDVGSLALQQGHVSIEHRSVARPADSPGAQTAPAEPTTAIRALHLAGLEVIDIDVAVTDTNLAIPARLDVGLRRLSAEGLHWPAVPGRAAALVVEAALPPNGEGSFTGQLDLAATRLQGRLASSRLPLPAFAPWVHALTRLSLNSGEIGQQADLDLRWGMQPVDLSVLLDARIAGLSIADPDGIDLIAWDSLDLRGLELDLATKRVTLSEVTVAAPTLRFARLADGRTNLTGIGPVSESSSKASEPSEPSREQSPAWEWAVGRFALEAGTLDFIDETLVIPFATRVEALSGRVDDVASNADGQAELRLDGRIPPTGSARIEARGLAMDPFAQSELELSFRGVPMPRMTPWTGTFAGYRVAAGRLDLDLAYRIHQGELDASNKITVNAMHLGERVDSPRAMDVPLRLALALLRDRDNNILLEVPVSGQVDDPQFELRPVILRAIRNVLTNIVAAPFRLLAGLAGGSDEQLDRVVYTLGSAALEDDQEARLLTLERALGQRPALGLLLPSIHGGEADRAALRAKALERELASRSADRDAALQTLFRERYGDQEFEALEAVHRSAMLARDDATDITAASGTGAAETGTLLIEIENRLLDGIIVSDDELHALARSRAETVYLYLTDAGLSRNRIRIATDVSEVELAGEQVPLSFELNALDP